MRRLVSLLALLLFSLPVGISLAGCGSGSSTSNYCNGSTGPQIGSVQYLTLQPQVGGISLNTAQTSTLTAAQAFDCKNSAVTAGAITYAVTPAQGQGGPVDINPTTGALCAGIWNRNTAGGVPNFSTCTGTGLQGIATVTASSGGANSNKIFVYVHDIVTSIQLGAASTDCVNDPATSCPQYTATTATTAPPYDPNSCISFGQSAQLVARFFAGTRNITYSAGHAIFTPQTTSLVNIESDSGVVTAQSPGSTVVTAQLSQAKSSAGFVSVCPPKTIALSSVNAKNGAVTVNQNTTEPLTAVVTDTKGVTITGLTLTYTSSNPVPVTVSSAGILPVFPASAAVNVFCQPPSCNPSPLDQVGRLGNGKTVSSNTLLTKTLGAVQSRLWIASTDSRYLTPVDLSVSAIPPPVQLPYQPNSLVLTQDGATIYLGSDTALMTFATASNGITSTNTGLQGPVLAVSPTGTAVVISDPNRKVITLYGPPTGTTTNGTIISTHDGVGTRAAYAPDGQTVYVTTNDNRLLVYSSFTGWSQYDLSATGANDVAITVPEVGAFVGGNTAVSGRSFCPNTAAGAPVFYPQASLTTVSAAIGDRLAATNDGLHLLDARLPSAGVAPVVNDLLLSSSANGATAPGLLASSDCPEDGTTPAFQTTVNTAVLTGVPAGAITGIFPSSNSAVAFVTYTATSGAPSTGALLPAYRPAATGVGTVAFATLARGAVAPVAGVFSTDDSIFFAGTSGDNLVHLIQTSTLIDTLQINPRLPSTSNPGGQATPNLIVQRPRAAQ